jgi:hypothetical protein
MLYESIAEPPVPVPVSYIQTISIWVREFDVPLVGEDIIPGTVIIVYPAMFGYENGEIPITLIAFTFATIWSPSTKPYDPARVVIGTSQL